MKKTRIVLLTLAVCLVSAACAWAAAEGHDAPNWKNFLWRVVNFAAVVAVVVWFGGKKIANMFRSRRQGIENQLSDLEDRKASAQKRLAEVERSIANLESERAEILADYKAQGEALKASIVKAAEEQAERVKAQALISAEQEAKMAADALRVRMADKIIEAAQDLLAKKLTPEVQDKLVDDALGKVVLN